jgi:hypothetical protein
MECPRRRSNNGAVLVGTLAAAATVLVAPPARPDVGSVHATTRGQVAGRLEITLTGTISSTVVVSVEGSVNQNGGAVTTVAGSGTQGTVDFGNFRAGGNGNGERYRVEGVEPGYYLVATLRLKTEFSGGGSRAVLDVQRTQPCSSTPGVPCGALFYARMVQRMPNQPAAWPGWNSYPDPQLGSSVFEVPDASYVPGAGNLDDLMANGESIDHQLAVWVPDRAPDGPLSTQVTYTVTRL